MNRVSQSVSDKQSISNFLDGVKFFSVAIVEPEFPLNVGYIGRIMANFGMKRLFIVSNKKMSIEDLRVASRFASHGEGLIGSVRYVKSVSALRRRFEVLIGTTAIAGKRKSNLTRKTQSLEDCARAVSNLGVKPEKVCILLGRDTTGLTNAELELCDYSLSIRTGSEYNTLNISHAAAVIFYVFSRAATNNSERPERAAAGSRKERDLVVGLFEELAMLADFQEFKRKKLRETLIHLLNRSNPSLRELYLLMGLASKSKSKIRNAIREKERLHALKDI